MKNKIKKNSGLTLIEAMIVLGLGALMMVSFLIWQRENALNENSKLLGQQFITISSAIDEKISISGFSVIDENATGLSKNVWQDSSWTNTKAVVDGLLRKELIARDSVCGNGSGWSPSAAKETKRILVPCQMWSGNKLPFGFETEGKVVKDADGFVSDIYILIKFVNARAFTDNLGYLAKAVQYATTNDSVNKTGRHLFEFANKNTLKEIGLSECQKLGSALCVARIGYSRNNAYEYLRTDGTNSMLNTNISFKKDKATERMKCNRWVKGADGSWTLDSKVDCGIGVYKPADSTSPEAKAGNEDNVQIVVDYSTQKEIHMNKSCAVFGIDYAGTGTDVIKDLGLREPCGILSKEKANKVAGDPLAGDVVYQLVDRVTADQGYFKDLYGRKLFIEDSAFIRGDLNVTGDAIIQGATSVGSDLTVGGVTAIQGDLGVNSDATISGNTTLGGTLKVDGQSQLAGNTMIKGQLDVEGNAGITKDLKVYGNTEINGKAYYKDGLKIQGGAEANTFLPDRIVNRGAGCSKTEKGLIAKDATGKALSCVLPDTTKPNDLVWGDAVKSKQYTCPSYIKCEQKIPESWDFCGFSRVGNLENSHFCSITNEGTPANPKWAMDGYKGGCVVFCMSF